MPIDSVKIPRTVLQWRHTDCPGKLDEYQLIEGFEVRSESRKLESHRVRPSPLVMHPTSLGPYRKTVVIAEEFKYNRRYKTGCFLVEPPVDYYKVRYGAREYGHVDQSWRTELPKKINSDSIHTNMRLKIKDERVNLASDIAEYQAAVTAWSSYVRATYRAYRRIRKMKTPRRKRMTPCHVASGKLALSFGVAPTVRTVIDSIEALKSVLNKAKYKRFTSIDNQSIDLSGTHPDWDKLTAEVQLKLTAWVEFDPQLTGYDEFTVGNPLEMGWELVPFSFVIDWGIPIGDWLSSLDALQYVRRFGATLTERTQIRGEFSTKDPLQTPVKPGKIIERSYVRTVDKLAVASRPHFRDSPSNAVIKNGIALLTSMTACKR